MKLSIIIPAYNSAKFIEKCVRSCETQDLETEEYEVIIVDDGSTDNTKECIQELQKEFSNIIYIYQENARQGAARNNGLRNSRGKYIWYVDSDDWITENCLGIIISKLERLSLTGILVGRITQYKNEAFTWYNIDEDAIISGKDILNGDKYFIPPTYAIWKREYLIENNLYFKENLFHEDSEFYPRLFYRAERIGAISKACYCVYPNLCSTTRGINPQRAFDIVTVARLLNDFRITITDKCINRMLIDYISMTINSSLYNSFHLDNNHIKKLNQLWYKNKDLLAILLKSKKIKYKIEGLLFSIFPQKTCFLYKLLQSINRDPGKMNYQKKMLHTNE